MVFRERPRIVSIQLVSPTSGEPPTVMIMDSYPCRFHSISFPNEWGDRGVRRAGSRVRLLGAGGVSIQLVSPTSGETQQVNGVFQILLQKFPFN